MLSLIVGNVDASAAAVLVAGFVGITVIVISFIAKYQSRERENNEFELAKLRIASEERQRIFQFETDRVYKTKQLEHNLITSHRSDDARGVQ